MADLGLTFARPAALWLLATLPLFALVGIALGLRRRRLPRAALALRLAVVTLLTVTLAEPLLTSGAGAVSTVFVVDRSGSVTDPTVAAANGWVAAALREAGVGSRAAIVTFGASPSLAAPAGSAGDLDRGWMDEALPALEREYTDVESALALARALPLGGSRRLVVLSDGAENVGSALNQAGQAAADGIPIDVVPLPGVDERDLRIEGATAPTSLWQGEPVTVLASVATGLAGTGRVELWVDGVFNTAEDVEFPVGLSSYDFKVEDLPAGFHALEVRVSGPAAGDRYPQNNRLPIALVVRDRPELLLVVPEGSDGGALRGALERQGAVVTQVRPDEVPSRRSELGAYDAFLLDNVPAGQLSLDQQAGLQDAARSLGRGLVVLGGNQSYGPGGYAGTLLEEALPVTVKVTDGRQRQRVAVLLIFDKSGSMTYDPLGRTSKIDMAKQAVKEGAQSLTDGDQVGILSFNDQQEWVVAMTTIEGQGTRDAIDAAVEAVAAEGGTEIYPALAMGFDAIRNVDADVRHIVLLSDGKSRTGTREAYQRLIDDAIADRTTLSAIAIGEDADTDLLHFLADEGGGNYHFTDSPEDIPRLTLEEARSAGSQSVIRGPFEPIQKLPSPILGDFEPEDLPDLDGYDFAEPKPDAQVVLTSTREDPVLAKWQYGLGRVVAWTADDGVDFAAPWAGWEGYDEFWGGVVRWVLPDPENRPIQMSVSRDGPEAVVTVETVGEAGDFADADVSATITAPSGAVLEDRALYQVGPGQYQLRVAAPEAGAYRVDLRQRAGGQVVTEELAGFAVPPSPELQPAPDADALLRALAARTGGRVLSLDEPAEVFADDGLTGSALRDYRPLWYVPLALALVLLLAEIAVRMRFAPRLSFWRRG